VKNLKILIAIAVALALAVPIGAAAHVRENVPTSVTIKASDKKINAGQKVTFSGKLSSEWKKCKSEEKILLFRNATQIGQTRTNGTGKYSITKKLNQTGKYSVKYPGRSWGTHPHSHSCLPSQSAKIKIRVT
jgi:hypothetical protein